MNNKMREYLEQQFSLLNTQVTNAFVAAKLSNTGVRQDIVLDEIRTLVKYVRYIEHAVMESTTCEHCQEVGLTDTKGQENVE